MTGNLSAWPKLSNRGTTVALTAGIAALLLCAGRVLGCPGCAIEGMRRWFPELIYWEAILSVWVISVVAIWLWHEFCRPQRKLRIAIATAVLAFCTPWVFDLPLGPLAGMFVLGWMVSTETRLLAKLGRCEPVWKGVLLGLASTLGWYLLINLTIGAHAITFLACFVPTIVMAGAYTFRTKLLRVHIGCVADGVDDGWVTG